MPLSEEEQRVLQEIEKNFYEHDPAFADRVRSETVYRHSGRNLKWAAFAFIVGLTLTLLTFAMSVALGVVGFFVMLASAVIFETNLRRVSRAGWRDISANVKSQGASNAISGLGKRMRDRFGKPE